MKSSETFVFDGTEVVKTGREAARELKSPTGKLIRILILVEIKPVDESFDWHKWVDPATLFIIQK